MDAKFLAGKVSRQLSLMADSDKAGPMMAYMKNHFPFFGVSAGPRRIFFKEFCRENDLRKKEFMPDLMKHLWDAPQRECQYVAMDYFSIFEKKVTPDYLPLLEELILKKSWWDTVDFLAPHGIGSIFLSNPALIEPHINRWLQHESIWLNRTCLIFQLRYKKQTRLDVLSSSISKLKSHKEFFIQKAIGWSLREYSKTNGVWVSNFVEEAGLIGLAKREALRLL